MLALGKTCSFNDLCSWKTSVALSRKPKGCFGTRDCTKMCFHIGHVCTILNWNVCARLLPPLDTIRGGTTGKGSN